ncbi:MAG: endolytic transglycosylase MltG [Flavobacteriaceae bacterium]
MYRRKIVIAISILGIVLGGSFIYYFYQVFFWSNTAFENDSSYLFIDRDDSLDSLSLNLTPLLKSIDLFRVAAEKKGYATRLRSGKFKLLRGMGNNEIINELRANPLPVKVTFNNQERIENLAGRIAAQIEPDSLSLLEAFLDTEFLSERGFTKQTALCLYLPNTYDLYWHSSAEEFRTKIWEFYQQFWNEERRAKAKSLRLTPIQVSILASIVVKESVKKEEQPTIAGVYLNRLKKGMKLQADPTVIYAIKEAKDDFDLTVRRVLYRDLELDSPYNTYKVKGLPPGPIAMADLSSIDAVLNAEQHSYLYFVAAPERPGYHLFASSLGEHNQNKLKYTQWLNRQKIFR